MQYIIFISLSYIVDLLKLKILLKLFLHRSKRKGPFFAYVCKYEIGMVQTLPQKPLKLCLKLQLLYIS